MTKKLNPHEKKLYLAGVWRGILISAAAVAATYAVPKGVKALNDRLQDADYAEEHFEIERLNNILEERRSNSLQDASLYGIPIDENTGRPVGEAIDSYEEGIKKELEIREKRHAREKKNAPCKYCEKDPI